MPHTRSPAIVADWNVALGANTVLIMRTESCACDIFWTTNGLFPDPISEHFALPFEDIGLQMWTRDHSLAKMILEALVRYVVIPESVLGSGGK